MLNAEKEYYGHSWDSHSMAYHKTSLTVPHSKHYRTQDGNIHGDVNPQNPINHALGGCFSKSSTHFSSMIPGEDDALDLADFSNLVRLAEDAVLMIPLRRNSFLALRTISCTLFLWHRR